MEKCRCAFLRSKAQWTNESDKCTKYFLNLEKIRQKSNSIKELIDENEVVRNSTEDLLEIQYNFYSKSYVSVRIEEESKKEF